MTTSIETFQKTADAVAKYGTQKKAAEALGIGERTVRTHLSKLRLVSSDGSETFAQECAENGVLEDDVSAYWLKTDKVSMFVKRPNGPSYDEIRDSIIEEMIKHAPKHDVIDRPYAGSEEHLLIIDPADVHIGKLVIKDMSNGEYNIAEAVRRLKQGVHDLVRKASVFGLERIALIIGNDILHVDNNEGTTTKGTRQDSDGKFWQMYNAAKLAYIEVIADLIKFAPVTVIFNPSNHDYASGFMLADSIYSWYHNSPEVSFGFDQRNIDMRDRKYLVYGNNLIGFTHGDGAKEGDLQLLMQYEARVEWGQTTFAYMYAHHLHHKIKNTYGPGIGKKRNEKDHPGITVLHTGRAIDPTKSFIVETVRSPSPSDHWHTKNGYMNVNAIEAFLHHYSRGQVARFTEFF